MKRDRVQPFPTFTASLDPSTRSRINDARFAPHELGAWLDEGFPRSTWAAWATLTFGVAFGPSGPTPDRALLHFRRWREGLPFAARPRPVFCAVERGGREGRTHIHALLGPGDAPVPRRALWRSWFRRFGRAQILPFDPDLGAPYYVAKYVTKAPEHWDIFHA